MANARRALAAALYIIVTSRVWAIAAWVAKHAPANLASAPAGASGLGSEPDGEDALPDRCPECGARCDGSTYHWSSCSRWQCAPVGGHAEDPPQRYAPPHR